jgi:5-methyltetrahydropteroyltriglutamate--homocysteine methyltransferase
LEDEDYIISRIKEASPYLSLEQQLALSPRCGFFSTEAGNVLTETEQWN